MWLSTVALALHKVLDSARLIGIASVYCAAHIAQRLDILPGDSRVASPSGSCWQLNWLVRLHTKTAMETLPKTKEIVYTENAVPPLPVFCEYRFWSFYVAVLL